MNTDYIVIAVLTVILTAINTAVTAFYFYNKGRNHADLFAIGEVLDYSPILEQLAAEQPETHLSLITPIEVK